MTVWDDLLREIGRTMDQAVFGVPALGIRSALPAPAQPAAPLTVEDMMRTMRQIYASNRAVPTQFRCGSDVPDRLTAGLPMVPDSSLPPCSRIFGVPIIVDDRLGPDEWRVVDEFGRILHSSNLMPGPFAFPRFEQFMVEDEAPGDLLGRIDAVVDAWEHGRDAYRYIPDDTPERGDLTE